MARAGKPGDQECTTELTQTTKQRQRGNETKPEGDLMRSGSQGGSRVSSPGLRRRAGRCCRAVSCRWTETVGFPRGRGDKTTVGISAGGAGGSQPSDWGPWSGVAAETEGESVGKPGNRENEAMRSGSCGGLGN